MSTLHKRIIFWSILVASIVISVWWVFHFPYSRERLYRTIPGNALIIGEHPDIAGRWKTCLKTPLVRAVLNAQGVDDAKIERVMADKNLARVVEMLAGRNTVIAYVPALDTARRPAWLFASWAGAYCQPLRWGWSAGKMKDFERIKLNYGRRGWRLKPGKLKGDMHLTVAATEGIVLGCLSSDPFGVRYILDRIDSKFPLTATAERLIQSTPASSLSPSPPRGERAGVRGQRDMPVDRMWFEWGMQMGDTMSTGSALMGVTLNGEAGSEGWFRGEFLPELPVAPGIDARESAAIGRLLRNAPDAAGKASLDELLALLPDTPAWEEARTIGSTIARDARVGAPFFAGLLTGDYSGEIAGMTIAGVVAGVRLKDGTDAMSAVGRLLDELNAEHSWSLIPVRMKDDGVVIRLDSTQPGTFKLFPAGKRPAFAAVDDWLIFCTNRQALEKLLALEPDGGNRWISRMVDGPGIHLAGDLAATGKAVENAVAAYTLIMDIQAGKKNKALAARLELVRAWARMGAVLQTGSFRLHAPNDQPEIQFRFRPAAK